MAGFEAFIDRVRDFVAELEAGGAELERIVAADYQDTGRLCVRVGPRANTGVILRSDTFAELGNPELGSCGMVLWCDDPSRVADGRITRIGPDISAAAGGGLPFAQIVLVAGRELGPDDHSTIVQSQYVADQIEGFMVRSSSSNLWCRVSKEAAAKGFRLETLGRAMLALTRRSVPRAEAVEIVFVTSSPEHVRLLRSIADEARELGRQMVEQYWKERGFDLECDFDCNSCADQSVCDGIREIARLRSKHPPAANGDRSR
ncbi:MAG: hypothetical protein D6815_06370 [Candidatus Dadabacteria bacterium]|nr:MAG: hypothetical protein D6815_06370 [Candidatus Dadabacteria bacterium]